MSGILVVTRQRNFGCLFLMNSAHHCNIRIAVFIEFARVRIAADWVSVFRTVVCVVCSAVSVSILSSFRSGRALLPLVVY